MTLKRPEFPSDHVEENGNLLQVFLHRARFFGSKKALFYKIDGEYTGSYTWCEWMERAREVTLALYALGIRKGDPVGILAENCPEWTFADLGILGLGAVTVPIYPTLSTEDIRYIIDHAGLKALFVATPEQHEKVRALSSEFLPGGLVVFFADGSFARQSLASFREKGRDYGLNHAELYEQCVKNIGADDLATIIYTSGTTGAPKGVMLTHRNFIANYQGAFQYIQISDKDSVVSFLPLSHVFERLAGYYYQAAYGVAIYYAENFTTVADDIRKVRPTIVVAVPRFYEKMHARILEQIQKASPLRQKFVRWAIRIGTRVVQMEMRKQRVPFWLAGYHRIAKGFVFRKIRQAMGGRIRFFISGGAPLPKDLARFFYAADILILEGYGLTETSPVIAVNSPVDLKIGTVGKVIPGVRVKIAPDGEILTSGPCVMKGYYKNEAATADCIKDGWLHTGDIGTFDSEGFLKITDRKKDIIVLSGGKNVAPQNVEGRILGDSLFLQAVVLGDKRPYLCALIVPQKNEVLQFAAGAGLTSMAYEALLKHQEVIAWVRKRLDAAMDGLASYETVKAFILLPQEFSQAAGEMTPTMKIKRRVVMKAYGQAIDALYRNTDQEWSARKNPAPPQS